MTIKGCNKLTNHFAAALLLFAIQFNTVCKMIKDNHFYSNTVYILVIISMCLLTGKDITAQVKNIELNKEWSFSEAGSDQWMSAKVPGTVHTDLLTNDIIEDPHYRLNEDRVQWIGERDWIYKTTFTADGNLLNSNKIELIFEGLDTYSDVYLNDHLILHADNMFIGWEVDVKEHLKEGQNELLIYFHSPVKEGMKKLSNIDYYIPAINEQAPMDQRTSVFTRKAPFHFGWDWGPRLVTSGIWRPVSLRVWDVGRIESVYVDTKYILENEAWLYGYAEIEIIEPGEYRFSLNLDDQNNAVEIEMNLAAGTNRIPFEFRVDEPKLWWTNGLGEPYLYDFKFELTNDTGAVDHLNLNFGIRTLRLVQEPDDIGRTFYFELNGVPVFMKGANVIPSETLTPSVTTEVYERLFDNTLAANMNMLRVWGGAIYEEALFYELADRSGILIWQDFMFACNLSPGDEPHLENIRKEAEYNVKRLRNYPSIAVWTGNNENLHGWHHWGWKESYDPETREFMWRTYDRIFHEILPDVVNRNAPGTPYWSSSPSSYGNTLADRRSGDEHDWTIWFGQEPFSSYGRNVPRFISEYGMQAFPGMHTIREFAESSDFDMDSEVMRHRQRGTMEYIAPGFDGNDMIKRYMERYYPVPEEFDEFVYVSQIMHGMAYKTAIEAHRRNMPVTMGSLYWQLNDSWPTISWATVDYYGRWKAAHYKVRDAYRETIISPVLEENNVQIFIVSDRIASGDKGTLVIKITDFFGRVVHEVKMEVMLPENSSEWVYSLSIEELSQNISDFETSEYYLSATLSTEKNDSIENFLFFEKPSDLRLPKAEIEYELQWNGSGYVMSIRSDVFVKDLYIEADENTLHFSDNFFDLEAGVLKEVRISSGKEVSDDLEIRFYSVNQLIQDTKSD